jgi:hypothetical protein
VLALFLLESVRVEDLLTVGLVAVVVQLAVEGHQFGDFTRGFGGFLTEFTTIECNGARFKVGFRLFLIGTDGHVFDPEGIFVVVGGLEEGRGVHGYAVDPGPPGIVTILCIFNKSLLGSLVLMGIWILLVDIILNGILDTFLVNLIDKILAVFGFDTLHFGVAATLVQVLFLVYLCILPAPTRRNHIFGHVLIESHPLHEGPLPLFLKKLRGFVHSVNYCTLLLLDNKFRINHLIQFLYPKRIASLLFPQPPPPREPTFFHSLNSGFYLYRINIITGMSKVKVRFNYGNEHTVLVSYRLLRSRRRRRDHFLSVLMESQRRRLGMNWLALKKLK